MIFWDWVKTLFHPPTYPEIQPLPKVNEKVNTPRNPDWTVLWQTCKIDEDRKSEIAAVCKKITDNKEKYLAVEAKTKVPWYLIAALHYREASLNFKILLAQWRPTTGSDYSCP